LSREDNMPTASMQEILKRAFAKRYGVAAFNMVNDLTMEATLAAAAELRSPLIVQVSVKTVKFWGAKLIQLMFAEMAGKISVPATLHLDHCPDVGVIKECLEAGWNSVLFDGSGLSYEECLQQTKKVVALAHRYGAAVEGEIEPVKGVEDGLGSEAEVAVFSTDKAVAFIRETGIDSFAPAIGTAHGVYKAEPKINFGRVDEIVAAVGIPLVIHGGTGLSEEVFHGLIGRGAVKVNISTELKITFADSLRQYLEKYPKQYDPLKLLGANREAVKAMAARFITIFGSQGQGL
jgi:fructose-bisphosphate aldolase class II